MNSCKIYMKRAKRSMKMIIRFLKQILLKLFLTTSKIGYREMVQNMINSKLGIIPLFTEEFTPRKTSRQARRFSWSLSSKLSHLKWPWIVLLERKWCIMDSGIHYYHQNTLSWQLIFSKRKKREQIHISIHSLMSFQRALRISLFFLMKTRNES